jgi:hypothetical protein
VRGLRLHQRRVDRRDHVIGALQNVIVPESQDAETQRLEFLRSSRVISRLMEMLTAVRLDNQPALKTYEVNDVTGNLMLAAKFVAKLIAAQSRPQFSFRIGGRHAQTFLAFHALPPHPTLSPKRVLGRGLSVISHAAIRPRVAGIPRGASGK